MPTIKLTLDPQLAADLDRQLAILLPQIDPRATLTLAGLARALLLQGLRHRQRARSDAARDLLARYLPVPRAVAAEAFRRCQGAIALDDLQSVAYEGALKGARRFRAELGFSPAPYLRRWAEFEVNALLRQRSAESQEVRPDQDEPGRWERLGGETAEGAADPVDLRRALLGWGTARQRKILRLALGVDKEAATRRYGCSMEEVHAMLASLRAHLHTGGVEHAPDEEVSVAEAAQRSGISPKAIGKRIRSGTLLARKQDGRWMVFYGDVLK